MSYQCPKGHTSADPDYCSECGAKIGPPASPKSSTSTPVQNSAGGEICPDCGTPRVMNARFCEVCRYDFIDGKTVTAEKVVDAEKSTDEQEAEEALKIQQDQAIPPEQPQEEVKKETPVESPVGVKDDSLKIVKKDEIVIGEKLNIVISVDKARLAQNQSDTNIKSDSMDRVFPLDLDENLVGRRSNTRGIYPEIEINDPGVSHRHLKFIKQKDGTFAVLELGSANGTEYNGTLLAPGISTVIKSGDEFAIGLWTTLKVVGR